MVRSGLERMRTAGGGLLEEKVGESKRSCFLKMGYYGTIC